LLILGDLPPLTHERFHQRIGQEGKEIAGIRKAAGHPNQLHIATPEAGGRLDPDPDINPHDLGRFEELFDGLGPHIVVVDHRQSSDTLDPGIHNQVGWRFAALGVEIVHMIIKGFLVPLFRHFQEKIAVQESTDVARLAGCGGAKIVSQLQLTVFVIPRPHHLLHDNQEHPGHIVGHGAIAAVHHFITEAPQRRDAVISFPQFEGFHQAHCRIGHAEAPGSCHFLDSARVHVRIKKIAQVAQRLFPIEHVIDDAQQVVIPAVKKEFGDALCHRIFPKSLVNPGQMIRVALPNRQHRKKHS